MRVFRLPRLECVVHPAGGFIPAASRAAAVLDWLRLELSAAGAEERTGSAVESAEAKKGGFLLRTAAEAIPSRLLLVCAGGAAAPALGGGSGGYGLLSGFGHRRTPLFPSIVQVKTDPTFVRALKGVRLDGRVAFELDGRCLAAETGELLFTEYGLSGPAVMQISRVVGDWERRPKGRMEAVLDLLPDMEASRLRDTLLSRRELPGRTLEDYLTGFVHKRLGADGAAGGGAEPEPARGLPHAGGDRRIAALLKGWRIPVIGTQGLRRRPGDGGGVSAEEFHPGRWNPGWFPAFTPPARCWMWTGTAAASICSGPGHPPGWAAQAAVKKWRREKP